jgi:hypothetical protein
VFCYQVSLRKSCTDSISSHSWVSILMVSGTVTAPFNELQPSSRWNLCVYKRVGNKNSSGLRGIIAGCRKFCRLELHCQVGRIYCVCIGCGTSHPYDVLIYVFYAFEEVAEVLFRYTSPFFHVLVYHTLSFLLVLQSTLLYAVRPRLWSSLLKRSR